MTGALGTLSDDELLQERERLLKAQRHEDLSTRFDTDPSSLTPDELGELKNLSAPQVDAEKQARKEVGSLKVTGPQITSAAKRTAAAVSDAISSVNKTRRFTLDGINESIAETLGMPVDLATQALGLAGIDIKDPVLGSKQIKEAFEKAGAISGQEPEEVLDRFLKRAAKSVGSVAGTVAGATMLAPKLAASSVPWLAAAFRELVRNPANFARRELAASVPAGTSAATAEEGMRVAGVPEESRGFKIGSLVAEILGGTFGAKSADRKPGTRTPEGREERVVDTITGRSQDHTARGLDIELGRNTAELEQLPGYRPTTAQASGDTGLLRTERDARTVAPGFEADLSDRLAAQMEAARDELSRLTGQKLTPTEAGQNIRSEIREARRAAKDDERAAWSQIDPRTRTPIDNVIRKIYDIKTGMKEGELASSMPAVVNDLGDNIVNLYGSTLGALQRNPAKALEDVQSWRSRTSFEKRQEQALAAPDNRKLARLQQLEDALNQAIDDLGNAPGEMGRLVREASRKTRERVTTFDKGPVGRVQQRGDFEGNRVPDSDVADTFVSTGKPQPETFASLVKATGSRGKAIEAAQNILMQNLERSITSGEGLSVNKLGKFLDDPSNAELLRAVYANDPGQIGRLRALEKNLRSRAQSTSPLIRGESTSAEKLTGAQGLREELSTPRIMDKILGARFPTVGGVTVRAAGAGARGIEDRLLQQRDALTFQLFKDAMLDPQLARDLIRRVEDRTDKRLQQRLHGYLTRYANPEEGDEEGMSDGSRKGLTIDIYKRSGEE